MLRRALIICMLLLVAWPARSANVTATATLDRDTVQLGETVTLNVRIQGRARGVSLPDLHALDQDFEILGSSQNSSVSIVNGTATSELTFGVALRPRHAGELTIPALAVGGDRTTPLQLQVMPPDPGAAAAAGRDVFMESRVEPDHGRVGQQLSYVVRLYYARRLSNGALDAPQADGVEVTRVGSDLNYEAERNGRNYHVLERRYALTPQRAGSIRIPAATFQGEAIDPRDPDAFFGVTTPVSAAAPAVTLDVQPVPADWGKSTWLPARELNLDMQGWPDAGQAARVGQPLNLTMTLEATGLPFEALPALALPALDGAKVYPDKPVTSTRNDGQWLIGRRQQTFAVVPEHAGTLTIPATTVKWWNVLTDRAEVAQIPVRRITVLPAGGGAATAPPATASNSLAAPAAVPATPWRWIALGSIGLWLLSMLAWWWLRRRPRAPAPTSGIATSSRKMRVVFLAAARGSDPGLQARSLLAWARTERPAIQHLGELSEALDDTAQRAAIAALQQRQYAGTAAAAASVDLAQTFRRGFAWRAVAERHGDAGLPPLYPFDLGDRR